MPKESTASLVRGGHVICRTLDERTVEVLDEAAVVQVDGSIEAVGPYADLAARYRDIEVIGTGEHVVIPGLVNAHHHIGVTPIQKGVEDLPLELWLPAQIGCRAVDGYLDTL